MTGTLYLSKIELDVLAVLEDRHSRGMLELAREADLPPFGVRSILAELRRRRLIERDLAYRLHITDAGLQELVRRRQLKLVS